MQDYDSIDFFTAPELIPDPYPYFDHLRSKCPVLWEPHHGVYAVTGYEEAVGVLKDTDNFSSCVSVTGPFPGLPFAPVGDDIGEQIDRYRNQLPMYEHMVTMDLPPIRMRAGC
jgi:cytochrome P450